MFIEGVCIIAKNDFMHEIVCPCDMTILPNETVYIDTKSSASPSIGYHIQIFTHPKTCVLAFMDGNQIICSKTNVVIGLSNKNKSPLLLKKGDPIALCFEVKAPTSNRLQF